LPPTRQAPPPSSAYRRPAETYRAIQRIADQHNRKVSDVVRDAIHQYLQAS
jgi:predicted transcriptional regulator